MNLKKIIREEINNELQWIKDVKSNKDIAEELLDQTVITKDRGIVKFPFMTSNIHPKKYYFDTSIRKKYGKYEDSDDIWERYKVLVNNRLKELRPKNLKESNDFDWVKDIDSKVDEETIDILYNKPFYWYSPLEKSNWVSFHGAPKIFWLEDGIDSAEVKVCTHQHNKEDFYTKDCDPYFRSTVVKKFNRGIYVLQPQLTNINESKNDFGWVDEIPTYDFYNGEYYIDISQLDDDEACEIQQTLINMGIDWREGNGEINKLHCSTFTNKGYIIRNTTLYRTTHDWDEYKDILMGGNYGNITYIDGRTDLLS